MKRFLPIIILVIVVIIVYAFFFRSAVDDGKENDDTSSETTTYIKKHSADFDNKVDATISSYIALKEAFVNADSVLAGERAGIFKNTVAEIPLDAELSSGQPDVLSKANQQSGDIQANTEAIAKAKNLEEMRRDFYVVSENLYNLLQDVGYEGKKLYWQHCPMAFDNKGANWLSNTNEILNPYMGRKHPVYKGAMLNCGENVDSLFVN